MGWACGYDRGDEDVYRILVEKCHGNCPLGGLRRRWEDNVKMDPRAIML
jgi:hypothetical protein